MIDLSLKIIRIILLCISCYGWCAYMVHKKKIKVEFALSTLIAGIGSIVFFAGILNMLAEISFFICGLGILLASCSLVKRESIRQMLSPGMVVFLVALIALGGLLYGTKYTGYDNFSHWGVVARLIVRENRFPNMQDEIVSFQSYPTGSASFIYYVCKITGIHAEWMMLYAQAVAIVALLIPIFAFVKKKSSIIIGICTVVLALCAVEPLSELHVDTLLVAAGTAGFLLCLFKDKIFEHYWAIIPNLIFLISIKNSGVFFVVIIIAYIIVFTTKKDWKKISLFILSSIFTLLAWQKHVKNVFSDGMTAKHSLSLEYFKNVFGDKDKDEILEILYNFLENVFSIHNEFIIFLVLALGLIAIAKYMKCTNLADIKKKIVFYVVIYILYQLSLLGMYIFSMPTNEAINVASYDRYHMTMVTFLIMVLMVEFIQIRWSNKNAAMGGIILMLILETMALTPDFSQINRVNWEKTERYKCEEAVEKYNVPKNASYMFLMDDDDYGYTYYFYRYYFETRNVAVYSEKQHPYIGEQWKNYDYLIVIDDTEKNRDYIKNTLNIDSDENFIILDEWKNQ